MWRFKYIFGLVLLFTSFPIDAASTWTGNPTEYQPAALTSQTNPALEALRQRSLTGQLTVDDVIRAAAEIKAVQENASTTSTDVIPVPSAQSQPESLVYARPNSDFQIPIDDVDNPLNPTARKQLVQMLNRVPLRDLLLVQSVQIEPAWSDEDRGELLVQTQGGDIALYGTTHIQEALEDGVAAVVYDSLQGSPQQQEWNALGDFSDFEQSFTAWMNNTTQAFEEAEQPNVPPKELAKLFFMASLFSDASTARTVIYDPAPKQVVWQVQDTHYGFGPYSFDVSHQEIVHLAYNGIPLGSSASTIPSQWASQGLGN